jgi:hypothetical protein
MRKIKTLFIIIAILNTSFIFAQFPQQKVNKCYYQQLDYLKKNEIINKKTDVSKQTNYPVNYSHINDIDYKIDIEKIKKSKSTLFIGQNDTVLINTDTTQNGDIMIYDNGVLIIDSAQLTLSGHLYAQDNGQIKIINNAHLHFYQFYVGQYYLWLIDSAKFEASDATVDANGVMHYVQIFNNSVYIAENTNFPDWTFRKIFNNSSLILEDVYHVGDIVVTDSCFVHLTRCDTLMPWLATPNGSVIDIQFPAPDSVAYFEFSETMPNIDGIGYTFIVDTCWRCWWSLETWPGSSVTISNSEVRGTMLRIPGSDTVNIYGIADYNYYPNLLVPVTDRHLEFVNTYAYWWNWYPMEQTIFYMDSCVFGEMIGRGSSEIYATRSIHDGATISLSVEDSAFLSFADGQCLAFISSWNEATFLLENSSVIPYWPYQSTNFAHGHSNLLAVNSSFEYEPEAMDSALVMFVALDTLDTTQVNNNIYISGSAWIDAGPDNSPVITFDRYKLYYCLQSDTIWSFISKVSSEVSHSYLGTWNTASLSPGEYIIRLTIWDNEEDSLSALRQITLVDTTIGINTNQINYPVKIFPNPANEYINVECSNYKGKNIEIKIYNNLGQIIHNEKYTNNTNSIINTSNYSKGLYLVKIMADDKTVETKLIVIQ